MFLTRMTLNPARRGTRRLLSSRQRLHAAVMASTPPLDSDEGRQLWRLDETDPAPTLYIAGPRKPDLTHIVEQAGWPTTEGWQTREYGPFLRRLTVGQRWHFRLTANPVRQLSQAGARSKFQGAKTPQQAQDWLVRRQNRLGFALCENDLESVSDPGGAGLDVVVSGLGAWRFGKHEEGAHRRSVTVTAATYEGTLTVVSADQLRAALTQGIGRARGYGCGLMTLAPV